MNLSFIHSLNSYSPAEGIGSAGNREIIAVFR